MSKKTKKEKNYQSWDFGLSVITYEPKSIIYVISPVPANDMEYSPDFFGLKSCVN